MAVASLDKIEDFTQRCKDFRLNLGGGGVSVLGDGAKWIWKMSEQLFGNTAECLDIFHAAKHISDCAKMLFKGRAIGSGVVEGACWQLRKAEKMTVLCAALYSYQWKHCWKSA